MQAIETEPPVELQIGYLKKLPAAYTGERHEVTAGRLPDGKHLWEERPGPPPASDDSDKSIFKVVLVGVKDRRPDYYWPEEANRWNRHDRSPTNEGY